MLARTISYPVQLNVYPKSADVVHPIQVHAYGFLGGIDPMTSSRNCTCQQRSVNCACFDLQLDAATTMLNLKPGLPANSV